MPITVGAIRTQRASLRKALVNQRKRKLYKRALVEARKSKSKKNLSEAFSKLDRAVKGGVIHKNKAARLKSRLSRLATKK